MSEVNESQNQQPEVKKKSGCLKALIIGVCVFFGLIFVLGIVSAIAVPGFIQYTQNSKMMEANENLRAIVAGATAYYQAEHMDPDTMNAVSEQYPIALKPVLAGPETPASIGLKHDPSKTDFSQGAWAQMHFIISMPHYYTYSYVSDGKKFVAKAYASLGENCDSVFVVTGDGGSVSSIQDISESHDCSPARLP